MLKKTINQVSSDIQLVEDDTDEVFVACASFEDRTTAVVNKLSKGYQISSSFVFKYDERNKTALRDQNFEKLMNALILHSKNVLPIVCDHHDPLDGISKIHDLCKKKGNSLAR